VLALLNTAVLLGSAIPSPRYLYLPINPANAPAVAFASGVGAKHIPSLDVHFGRIEVQCHIFDTGPAGFVGAVAAAVYAELGIPAPEPPEPWVAPVAAAADAEAVRNALKGFQRPGELAANPLAHGSTPDERAASVRVGVIRAIEAAFGDSDDERLQRRILELGYIDPSVTHEGAADQLHLSRAAYFRRLRLAVDRVSEWMLANRG
jgi:hypothetical protein